MKALEPLMDESPIDFSALAGRGQGWRQRIVEGRKITRLVKNREFPASGRERNERAE